MRFSAILLSGAASLSLAATSPALAQAQTALPSADEPQQGDTPGLQDIIVTATRTGETNLQDTPIAVTAFSPTALKDRGVTTALDLNGLAPNVSIGSRSGTGAAAGGVTIRGIGVNANPPASPAVGIYVDDVYIPAQFGNLLGTFDLAQVEILRGPQGTLFGRNTIGGALLYTSVKPKIGDLSAFAEITGGNLKRFDFAGGINVPLADWAALRFSGARTKRDGYVHDRLNNVNRGSEENSDLRVQLRLQPTPDLLIDLKVEELHQESNGPAAIQTAFDYTSILGCDFNPAPGATCGNSPPFGPGNPPGGVHPARAPGGLVPFISPDFYTTAGFNGPASFRATMKIAQGSITYNVSPNVKIKSITAYSDNTDLLAVDGDGTPLPLFANTRGLNRNKLFTQELQLSGNVLNDKLHFTLGAYYYDEDSSNTNACAIFGPSPVCANTTFGDYTVKTKSYAGYGQATFDITDQLSIVGGLRYTKEDINVTNPPALPTAGYPQKASYDNWSPLAGVNLRATDDILFYAKWSRGFRAGNFSPNLYAAKKFDPETAESYEIGGRWEFFNHRVRINPTAFITTWKDIQFNSVAVYLPPLAPTPTPAPIIQNAGNVRTKGLEIETQFAVTDHFTITASGALFEGHYTSLRQTTPPAPPGPVANVTLATPLQRAPESSFSIGGRYELPIGDGKALLSANYAWQATQRSATSNNDNVQIAAYGLLSARLGYTGKDDAYTVAVYANNLTNQKYLIGGINYGPGGLIPTREADVGRPREYGLTVRFNIR